MLKQRQQSPVTCVIGITVSLFADVKTENVCLRASLSSGQPTCWSEKQKSVELFLRKCFVCQEEKNNEKHLCTDEFSKCNVPQVQPVRANIFTSLTNLQRFIILDCVFIVCNVYISLQLFAHINKRFN